ncbi:MAG: hypothetical protein WC517_04245 [Patescibacteria group bacterium]
MQFNFKNLFQSRALNGFLAGLAVLIVMLVAFKAGMSVGFQKADFSYQWGDNYHRNFAGPRGGFAAGFGERDFVEAHGSIGQIIKLDGSTIVTKGPDNLEKVILIDEKTVINRFRDSIGFSGLKIDDFIVVIGEPNAAGQIEAKLIRVMPAPPEAEMLGRVPNPPRPGLPAVLIK